MKAVFTTRINPNYDDQPELRYHFPAQYLRRVQSTVGDLVVYYEPGRTGGNSSRRDGSQCYFATARVLDVVPDSKVPKHFYALIDTPSYLDFDRPVPFRHGGRSLERKLDKEDGSLNKGLFRHAVRNISDAEYEAIIASGFRQDLLDFVPDEMIPSPSFLEEESPFARPTSEVTLSRPFRDRAFCRQVREAYDRTCAFTGLSIRNGFGRPEVQAAHIQPVNANGPDTIRNGLALSSTFHWLFDRGLVSLSDDFKILCAYGQLPETIIGLMNADGYARVPRDERARPNSRYLRFHRESVFKG